MKSLRQFIVVAALAFAAATGSRLTTPEEKQKLLDMKKTGGHTWAPWRIFLSEMVPMLFKN